MLPESELYKVTQHGQSVRVNSGFESTQNMKSPWPKFIFFSEQLFLVIYFCVGRTCKIMNERVNEHGIYYWNLYCKKWRDMKKSVRVNLEFEKSANPKHKVLLTWVHIFFGAVFEGWYIFVLAEYVNYGWECRRMWNMLLKSKL